MKTLGVSFDYHDAAAALVIDGKLVAAETEERFTRVKHDARLPRHAMAFCLEKAGLHPQDLNGVVFYEQPVVKLDRILEDATNLPASEQQLSAVIKTLVRKDKLFPEERLAAHLGISRKRISSVPHHMSHAASAYYCSGFDQATVITLDGVGEHETATLSLGKNGQLIKLRSQMLPDSLGLFYSAMTAFLGFEVNEGEYKVMGMAGFGQPDHFSSLMRLFQLQEPFGFALDQSYFDFSSFAQQLHSDRLISMLGEPRSPGTPFDTSPGSAVELQSRQFANIAASVQKVTEEVILHLVRQCIRITGCRNVCLAGGVALNSLANTRIKKEPGVKLYVHPAAGDAGGAVGAAFLQQAVSGLNARTKLTSSLLGNSFSDDEIRQAIRGKFAQQTRYFSDQEPMLDELAKRLADGEVIGWFQGSAEWGPRSLGARSILANPAFPGMQLKVNELVKFREPFRPFAPSVLCEKASIYFEVNQTVEPTDPENFMLSVVPVRETYRSQLPAITHVDGTARVHRVSREVNPLFYRLLEKVGLLTGIPMLLNTSFNLKGDPIVGTPEDAIATFGFCGLDTLAIGGYLINK